MTDSTLKEKLFTLLAKLGKFAIGFLVLLGLTVFLGAAIPRNRASVAAEQGVRIWVLAGSIHTDLIVPARHQAWDWTDLVSRDDVRLADPSLDHLALGWGDRTFYLETRTWGDVKLGNVASAFVGLDETAMHVEWFPGGWQTSPTCRSLVLTEEQYGRLCRFMKASFRLDREGRAQRIDAPGYREADAFYEANGRYSVYRTCNTWTGEALAYAGVKVGVWTPTPWSVLYHLPSP